MNEFRNNISEWLLPESLLSSSEGDRQALRCDRQSLTYRQLLELTHQAGNRFLELGLRRQECVAIILNDSPIYFAAFLGAMRIGAVPALVSTFLEDGQLEYVINLCSVKVVLAEPEIATRIERIRPRLTSVKKILVAKSDGSRVQNIELFTPEVSSKRKPAGLPDVQDDDPAFFLFSSGSTGEPKAVVHAHKDIRKTVEGYGQSVLGLTPKDRVFSSSRLFFAYGLGNSLSFPLAARATAILCREKPTPEVIAKIFRQELPTVFFGVPAIFRALLEYHQRISPLNVHSLRYCVSAGEALPASIFTEWKRLFGLEILDGIGTTEALHMFFSNRLGRARPGSSGTLVRGYDARLVDDAGQEVEVESPGNLQIKGESFGYYFQKGRGFQSDSPEEWFSTGDIYRRDQDGFFYFGGRSADHFKVQGLWVSPQEIEEALMAHEAIAEAGVVGTVDEDGLARPAAFVVLHENKSVSEDELKDFLSLRLHSYKVPRKITFLDKLPRTATGKLQRYLLRRSASGIS